MQGLRSRFEAQLTLTPSGCLEFQGYRTSKGYGLYASQRAHRLAWTLANGAIPSEMVVCHRCDNPPCCNPQHLFLASQADNERDKCAKGRHHWQRNREYAVRAARVGAALPQRIQQLAAAREAKRRKKEATNA